MSGSLIARRRKRIGYKPTLVNPMMSKKKWKPVENTLIVEETNEIPASDTKEKDRMAITEIISKR